MKKAGKAVRGALAYRRTSTLLLGSTAMALVASPAFAQVESGAQSDTAIIVTGIRATIQDSIETKRDSTEIVDALSADEIGELPALSIGEALETLTGAASHREQGGATEISIRGLGPFLGSTVINGRSASNGSGDRSVNFSQFPSELFNKVGIYKTQSASLIEGGVAGQITLETVRPIDYGKRRIQGDFKINMNPDNLDIDSDQRFRKFGYRGTVSYIDQFNVGDGEVGISLGYSRNVTTNPEQEANVSNTLNYCKNDPTDNGSGVFDDGNCNSTRPATAGSEDFVIARNSYAYRQNITDDERDSFFAAAQIKPSPDVDINMDFQYSKRLFSERRNDLNFAEGRRVDGVGDINRLPFDLIIGPNGELQQFTGETRVETNSEFLTRDEEYYGGGLAIDVQATDRLKLSGDFSYSETKRVEEATQVRQRIENQQDIFGNGDQYALSVESDGSSQNDKIETAYLIRQNGSQIFNLVVQEFDVNNHDLFRDNARVRYDLEQLRSNSIFAARGDFEYEMDGFVSSVEGGVRFQELEYQDVPGASGPNRIQVTYSDAALAAANQACRTSFPETGFLSSVSGGNPLITNVDAAGNVINTTNTFATFDALCLAQTMQAAEPNGNITFDSDGIPIYPDGSAASVQNNDVNEKSWAGYVQANFNGEFGSMPVRGNLGLRAVKTKVSSIGLRTTLTSNVAADGTITLTEDTGNFISDTARNSYTEFLPSFNFVADVSSTVQARFAVFRALSRPDPSNLGFGRSFSSANDDDDAATVAEAIGVVTANGNPLTEPLLSWNFDAALEWYPNEDTILAGGVYYKSFNGGFDTTAVTETFIVDGQPVNAVVSTSNTTGKNSTIFGFEMTAAHRFSYLPKPLDGLGFKVSYNYASSNFEFQDDTLGAFSTVQSDGSLQNFAALIPPAEIFGLSKHVLSAQLYYQIGGFDFQGVYKYRSNYFQQFIATPGRVRYVQDTGVFEARISYELTKNIKFTIEGINLFNEPRINSRGTLEDFGAAQVYGPRYFAGVKFKF